MEQKLKPKIKKYKVIQEALERGIKWGLVRSKRKLYKPKLHEVVQEILHNINLELEEVIDYD